MPPLFAIYRGAKSFFGLLSYGINVNGYVVNDDRTISVWMQRRAFTNPRDPGKLDTFV